MIPPAFDYASPTTVNEALALLGQNPDAKILAGGHSLLPMMKFRLASPALLVDINKVDGLAYIKEEGGWLKIGAMTRESEVDRSALVKQKYPLLADTARVIADPIVRNWATVGGNLAHADPANDHPATMLAYGARLVAAGPGGTREIAIGDFFVGPFTTPLEHNEILTEIRIPAHKAGDGGAYLKIERKVGDYATAAVAVQINVDSKGRCMSAGIGLTNVGLTPIRTAKAAGLLVGSSLDDATVKAAANAAAEAAEPSADNRGSEDYKRSLVRTLTTRALKTAVERAKAG
ncbi:MAG: xanthine dehydrogenase family protein subunit M [Chloroflexi bacterium]|nr:xanthine dehydrogenase family protein subunit M [Chloroflexota bacterium]MBI5292674.1 xanthine dehydrogenase family protein subunit M [Chloroflexota bacterium]